MKRLKVTVTRDHIKRGKPGESEYCPIALALKGMGKRHVQVGEVCCCWDGGTADLPLKSTKFIERFDAKKPVKPFSFTLNVEEA